MVAKPPLIILNTWFFSSKISGYLVTSKPKKHASISFLSNLAKTKINKMKWRKHNRSMASGIHTKPDQRYNHMVLKNTYVVLNVNFYSVDEVLWFDHWFGLLCLLVCLNQKMTFRILFSLFNLRTIKTETVTNCIRKIRQSALMNSMYFSSQEHSLRLWAVSIFCQI